MKPLTESQLRDLGFQIEYKKREGKTVFKSCFLDQGSWNQGELVGSFYEPPTFLEIIDQIAENAKNRTKEEFSDKIRDFFS